MFSLSEQRDELVRSEMQLSEVRQQTLKYQEQISELTSGKTNAGELNINQTGTAWFKFHAPW